MSFSDRVWNVLSRHERVGGKVMGWFFLVGGVAIDLLLAVGLVYAITHSEWQWAVEAAIGLAILGGTPWLGWRFLQEYRSG